MASATLYYYYWSLSPSSSSWLRHLRTGFSVAPVHAFIHASSVYLVHLWIKEKHSSIRRVNNILQQKLLAVLNELFGMSVLPWILSTDWTRQAKLRITWTIPLLPSCQGFLQNQRQTMVSRNLPITLHQNIAWFSAAESTTQTSKW